ncbi:CPBP family intramembrane metalloprotease [Halomicroarcula sp. F13]|uniref:CPBP family intramembrane metalloprotease n=1 Tax=Haloarcula rubra TaxID=2487747 RepID=A0AAW4PT60_9EURY|nr:CPBP family intramembrane glutamic endopeptidase [Halomicroarcula rubra]MBX0324366.1 CPBP family intramembrane metalloprotease [Halomicroarcula rubra]
MTQIRSFRQLVSTLYVDEPVGNRLWTVLAITILPVPLVSGLYIIHGAMTGMAAGAYSVRNGYLVYGVVNLFVVALMFGLLDTEQRARVFAFRPPSIRELAAAILAFVVGLGVFQVTERVSRALGYQLQGLSYTLDNPVAVSTILIGAVVLAPVTEELLYRGLVLETLSERGLGPVSATALMTALFALIHLPNFGVAGTIFIAVWGILPAALRLRYDNLTGAILMHMLNNLFAYVIVVAAGWS